KLNGKQAGSTGKIALPEMMLRVIGSGRVDHPLHRWLVSQPVGKSQTIGFMHRQALPQGSKATRTEVDIVRASAISQINCCLAHLTIVRCTTTVDYAEHNVGMTDDIFGCRMNRQ